MQFAEALAVCSPIVEQIIADSTRPSHPDDWTKIQKEKDRAHWEDDLGYVLI